MSLVSYRARTVFVIGMGNMLIVRGDVSSTVWWSKLGAVNPLRETVQGSDVGRYKRGLLGQ